MVYRRFNGCNDTEIVPDSCYVMFGNEWVPGIGYWVMGLADYGLAIGGLRIGELRIVLVLGILKLIN
ncbi:hypothetical protein EXU57_14715 [Segetibacter sp. 3557_3]|nr:hypothetical protein EXU57_14715 [Segetibacter sp. 3557_3]